MLYASLTVQFIFRKNSFSFFAFEHLVTLVLASLRYYPMMLCGSSIETRAPSGVNIFQISQTRTYCRFFVSSMQIFITFKKQSKYRNFRMALRQEQTRIFFTFSCLKIIFRKWKDTYFILGSRNIALNNLFYVSISIIFYDVLRIRHFKLITHGVVE